MATYNIYAFDKGYQTTSALGNALTFSGAGNEINLFITATISTTGAGRAIWGDASGVAKMTLDGTVSSSGGTGIGTTIGGQSIAIGKSGFVTGNTAAILLGGTGKNTIDNKGVVVSFTGYGISTGGSGNSITNSGTINAQDGIVAGSAATDSNNMVFNSGTVVGTKDVVHLYGSGAFLHNSGFIGSDIGYAVKLTTTANATTKIVNSGHIGSGVAAISGGPGVDWVENNGMLQGAISLGGNDDIYDGRGGGSISQRLDLGDGNDTAYGSAGNEALGGDNDNDWLDGGFGDDDLQGGDGIDTAAFSGSVGATVSLALVQQNTNYGLDALTEIENLSGGSGADRFTGDLKANTLMGNAGNDSLDGGDGDDILDGGSGTDTVVFSGSLAAIANLALGSATGYGTDTLINIENLTGGAGADRFTGNSSANMLIGDAGNDTLLGGLGNDKLTGGSGADFFVFDTSLSAKKNVDTITDFRRVDDSFQLENAIFKKLAKVGALSKSSFVVGAKAKDKNDYIVYDKAKGVLYYDADGSGKGAAVKFAQLKKGLVIDHKDFFVI